MSKKFLTALLLGLTLSFASVSFIYAQSGVTDDEVNEIASQLFCPTCEAIPVDVCPTEVCGDWRQEIRNQLEAGRSEREILDYFAESYGSGVLANPPPRGIGLFVWIVPAAVAVFGSGIFVWQMRRLNVSGSQAQPVPAGGPSPVSSSGSSTSDSYRRRLEEELE